MYTSPTFEVPVFYLIESIELLFQLEGFQEHLVAEKLFFGELLALRDVVEPKQEVEFDDPQVVETLALQKRLFLQIRLGKVEVVVNVDFGVFLKLFRQVRVRSGRVVLFSRHLFICFRLLLGLFGFNFRSSKD